MRINTTKNSKRKAPIACLLLATGLFFALAACCLVRQTALAADGRFCRGVSVDGIDLSGLDYAAAERMLAEDQARRLSVRSLSVQAGEKQYDFYAPEIACDSDLQSVLRRAQEYGRRRAEKRQLRRGGKDFSVRRTYYLRGEEQILDAIQLGTRVRPVDAKLSFDEKNGKFSTTPHRVGKELRRAQLSLSIAKALQQENAVVTAVYDDVAPRLTREGAQAFTVLRARFSTSYASSQEGRKHNVALAAKAISGVRLENGETFSFNGAVGPRTEKNGYRTAKIILDGQFVDGVGGGVCQVSTTLYNAALLAGLTVTEQHPHSLAVGYVEPSFDAMVSGKSLDLKFYNGTGGPVFLRMTADGNTLTAEVYGLKNAATVQRKSVTVQKLDPPARVEVEDDTGEMESGQQKILQYAKNGLISEGYLIITENGVRREVKLRKDKYAAVGEIVAIGKKTAQGRLQDWLAYDIIPWARGFWKKHAT